MKQVPLGDKIHIDDYSEVYQRVGKDRLEAYTAHKLFIPSEDRNVDYTIHQVILFESCSSLELEENSNSMTTLKTSKINLGFEAREKAIRMGMLSKMSSGEKVNPCDDANCGDNTVCVPHADDTYDV